MRLALQVKRWSDMTRKKKLTLFDIYACIDKSEPIDFKDIEAEFNNDAVCNFDSYLSYEKAYKQILDKVADLPLGDRMFYLKKHLPKLRKLVSIFMGNQDLYITRDNDDALVFLLTFRHDNSISIFSDMNCSYSRAELIAFALESLNWQILDEIDAFFKDKQQFPEKYQEFYKKDIRRIKDDDKRRAPYYDEVVRQIKNKPLAQMLGIE